MMSARTRGYLPGWVMPMPPATAVAIKSRSLGSLLGPSEQLPCRCKAWLPPLTCTRRSAVRSRIFPATRAGRSSAARFEVLADPRGPGREDGGAHMASSIAAMCSARPAFRCSAPKPTSWCCSTRPSCFPRRMAGARILGRLFPRGLMLLDFDEHRLHRRALSVAFKSGPMHSYLAALDAGIGGAVAQWRRSRDRCCFIRR